MMHPEQARLDLVRQWLLKAAEDFQAVEYLCAAEAPLYGVIGFHCQQCIEKLLKAWLTWRSIEFRKTHDIVELLDLVASQDAKLAGLLENTAVLSHYAVATRYPGDIPMLSKAEATAAVQLTTTARQVIFNSLPEHVFPLPPC